MKIRILKTHPNAKIPTYATDGAAAFDLYAATVNGGSHVGDICYPGYPATVDTGLAFEVPDGYMLRIASRSGIFAKHNVSAFPGVIDSDFRGSVKVLLTCAHMEEDAMPARIDPGDRIAQAYLVPVPKVDFDVAEQLSLTERGAGGFGSTG